MPLKLRFDNKGRLLKVDDTTCSHCGVSHDYMTMLLNEIWRDLLGFSREFLCFHCIEKELISKRGYGYRSTDFDFSIMTNWQNPHLQQLFPFEVSKGQQAWEAQQRNFKAIISDRGLKNKKKIRRMMHSHTRIQLVHT
jgi:hypothetical protein